MNLMVYNNVKLLQYHQGSVRFESRFRFKLLAFINNILILGKGLDIMDVHGSYEYWQNWNWNLNSLELESELN